MPAQSKPASRNRIAAAAIAMLSLLLAGLMPVGATAAPALEVALTRDVDVLPVVHRSDERFDYDVAVSNTASALPESGQSVTCNPRAASWFQSPSFTYQWVRDGVSLGAANGAQTTTYTVQPDDAGSALQCIVLGSNAGGAAASFTDPVVISSDPVANPPSFPQPATAATSPRPTITGTGVNPRTCNAPTNWIGVTEPFTFQWLRNGAPIASATSANYTPGVDDTATNLQCQVIGANADGAALAVSNNSVVPTPSPTVPNNNGNANNRPFLELPNETTGPVTVELELPPGTTAVRFYNPSESLQPHTPTPNGWSCAALPAAGAQPAKAVCERSAPLNPESTSPPFAVGVALGAGAPDDLVTTATASGGGAASPAVAVDEFTLAPALSFGIRAFETAVLDEFGAPYTQAGGHPFSAGASFAFNRYRELTPQDASVNPFMPIDRVKTVRTETPRGFVGSTVAAVERCATVEDLVLLNCPLASAVGGVDIKFGDGSLGGLVPVTIHQLEPELGRPALFAFTVTVVGGAFSFYPVLRPEDGYAITLESAPIATFFPSVLSVNAVVCGFGAIRSGANTFGACKTADHPTANAKPLVTMPTRCAEQPPTPRLAVDSWQNPGKFVSKSFTDPPLEGCELVKFEPEMELEPTSNQADSPTGMDVEIFMPTDGIESKDGIAQANLKQVKVTLPQGMGVNAAASHGLFACSAAQIGINPVTGVPNDQEPNCPEQSKLGTIGVTTPLLENKLSGDVFIAKQGADNPFDSNLALYAVFGSAQDGITIKVAGEVRPDPITGQLEVVFDDNPEAPFSSVEMSFPAGPRANLINPPACGNYAIEAELSPWTGGAPVTTTSTFQVNQGPNGGPCPDGRLDPRMSAGTTSPVAGQPSPFVMRLTREDGTQRFTALDLATPRGLVASLRGIPYCPDAVLASISPAAETGQAQIDNPSCPAASLIGHASAGAGAGPNPFYVNTGRAYLAGPYKGAPLSMALVTPAVAGPIDLGNVVVRTALHVNPETAQITAISDPIPTILHGILLGIRDIRVAIDRPNFTQNPTSCAEMAVNARVSGDGGGSANLANRFQAMECAGLGFAPRVNLRLVGGTKRGGHPSLRAVVRPRPGDANIRRAAVSLPRSAFLDQANIRTVCTRVQWRADNCPKAARYGFARAWSPLLDQPLQGPVYLRSSDNLLPDLVADLRGPAHQPIKIEAAFRTDSIRGGIRSTIDLAPDAPVSRFVLRMQGGKRKGLIVNSRDICRGTNRANSRMIGHNGRRANTRPKVHAANCGKARKGAKGKRGKGKANRQSLSGLR